ncbi:MAG: PAS domain S-box protein [Planctomycetes bacterium]|nr:PAS domain S-box protein [Planctomycetota bacterium]
MNPSFAADAKAVVDRLPHIISNFPVPEVFYRIAEELKPVFHFHRLSLSLIREDKNSAVIEFLYSTYSDSHLPAGSVLSLNSSDFGEVLRTPNPVFVHDMSKGQCDTDALLLKDGIRSRVSLPLFYGGEVIGVCCMGSRQAARFSESRICLWKEMAPFVSMVAENVRLTRKSEESAGILAVEIAERKRIEASLCKLSLTVEQSPSAIIITDTKGAIEYVNPKFTQLTGYTAAEIAGKNPRILKLGEKSPEEYQQLWETLTAGKEWRGEFHNRKKDGKLYWASASISPVKNAEGVTTHFIGIQEDITVRKHMEEELKSLNELLRQRASDRAVQLMESEEKFRKISASANDAIIMLDDEERISYWNVAAEKIFGYSKEEAVGKRLHTLIIPVVFRNRHLEGFKEFQIAGQGPVIGKTLELTALRRDGEEFPIELSLSGVQIKGKWNAIGIIRDITERKRLNVRLLAEIGGRKKVLERLKQMVKELERSNSELQQFAYVASHDLQEPLRMVSSYTQLLGRRYKGKLDADADEFIAYAVDGAVRMQMLINDLLEYSRVGTRGKPFEMVNCLDIFDQAISNLKMAIEESGAVITHDGLPMVMADVLQFTQLFQNLLGNAIKFRGKETPCIHVSAIQKEGEWVFSIRDNGIGIDPQYVDRIFVIFQRLHSKEEYPGSGIGLAICKKIVERHGGQIWVESEPGKGATFCFTVPVVN